MSGIFIRGLRVNTIVGVYEHERHRTQPLLFDIDMTADVATPGTTDALEDALDYGAICERITDFVTASRFQLIETIARSVGELLRREFDVVSYRVSVAKPEAVENAETVGVIIEGP